MHAGLAFDAPLRRLGRRVRRLDIPPLAQFLLRRLASLVVVLWAVEIASFLIVALIPGDPARRILGPSASNPAVTQLQNNLGLNKPFLVQYADYTKKALHLHFGVSFATGQAVSVELQQRIWIELELIGAAILLMLVVGAAVGVTAGWLTRENRHKRLELAFTATTGFIGSIPHYLAATFLAFLFAVTWHVFPIAGSSGPTAIVLPAVSIALRPAALLARIIRVQTLDALAQSYIRSARSKRLPESTVVARYVLPNVLTAALTVSGTEFAGLVGGALIVENVFAWNGLGLLLTNAILKLDYPTIQGAALLLAVIVVVVNALVDLGIAFLDPRAAAGLGVSRG